MKTSLRKLTGFGLHKHEPKGRVDPRPLAQLDELAQAARVFYLLLLLLLLPFYSFSLPSSGIANSIRGFFQFSSISS